ncbi:helix-turn-helix domain-containing protein [Utexia brackfieldae]|uniref:helix-turn-helix domain-containing protein n=1 Tax=Utexia brackfieldae TaxID=3074108 RepID=UPI00370DA215
MNPSSIDYLVIGQRLRAYRIAASLRAEDVAENLKISRAAVYRLEKGEIVKIETLDRLAALLGTSLTSLLGVDVEYYSSGDGFFERMRQLEEQSSDIYSHFDPFSFLLTSPDYLTHLRSMLYESANHSTKEIEKIESALAILQERKSHLTAHFPKVINLVGLQQIERFLHLGLVGSLNIPPSTKMQRTLLARKEVEHLIHLIEDQRSSLQLAITPEVVPSSTFQIFYQHDKPLSLGLSPFRLGEFPNVTTGIASITSSQEAITRYRHLFDRLWQTSVKAGQAIDLLRKTLERY